MMNPDMIADSLAAIGLLPEPKGKMVRKEITLSDGSVIWARISRLTPRRNGPDNASPSSPTPRV
jgi:hypothetical protein